MFIKVKIGLRYIVYVILAGLALSACSTKKNTLLTRNYHNLTSHYNIYFNALEIYKEGLKKINLSYQDNFNQVLPINVYSKREVANRLLSDMEKTKKKCSKVITMHSIKVRPKSGKGIKSERQKLFARKKDYNKWVDDSYLLMGKAFYFQHDFFPAIQNFEYVIREFAEEGLKDEASVWLAKSHLELKNYRQAREILDRLEAQPGLDKSIKAELEATTADWYLRQEMKEDAINFLARAAELTDSKALRTRYNYILGQLYEEIEDYTQASLKYGEVLKMKPGYRMAFNARINMAKLYQGNSSDGKEIRKQLQKMLKDDKNLEFLDQIYYALAEIDMKEGNTENAINNYRLSTYNSYSNNYQKALSYLALGKLYYDKPEYIESSSFYDSCTMAMPEEFPGAEEIKSHSYGLALLAENLKVIKNEDSLLQVAAMPEAEREKLIAEKIEEAKKIEEELRRREEDERLNSRSRSYNQYGMGRNSALRTGGMDMGNNPMMGGGTRIDPNMPESMAGSLSGGSSGQWYFYNSTTLSFGESEFIKRFGRRKLEDNWRRSNKNIASAASDISTKGEEGDIEKVSSEAKSKSFQPTTREFYTADLPLTDSAKTVSNYRIETALFNVGKIFSDELDKPDESIDYYLLLNERYPETEKLLFSYYNLYKLYESKPAPEQAATYKDLIISKFPDSRSAKIISNPNYFQEIEDARSEVVSYYIQTYDAYLNGRYEQVLGNCLYADTGFLLNHMRDKFGLLGVMAQAKINPGNKTLLKDKLNSLVFKFPESEVIEPAKNLLSYLEKGPSDSVRTTVASGLRIGAVDEAGEEDTEAGYTYAKDDVHFYVAILGSNNADVNRLKYDIANFNVENFDQDFFEVKSEVLSENLLMITVRNFPDAKSGLDYYRGLLADPVVYAQFGETDYRHFIISKANYSIFFKNKNVFNYIRFYNENYLNQDN